MNEVENPNVEETKENLEETPETTDNMTAETSQSVTENEHGSDRNGKEKGKSFVCPARPYPFRKPRMSRFPSAVLG